MASNEKITPLLANNNANYDIISGITYFKLKSDFEGDYTKNCGLLGEEIDKNFYFLRSYDIKNITFEDKNLIIERVGEKLPPIVVEISQEAKYPTFEYNKETGVITVTYPDGTVSTIEGFFVEEGGNEIFVKSDIYVDGTLKGDGTNFKPLGISPTELTGVFKPVDAVVDYTKGEKLPIDKIENGYRVITKKHIDNFGDLFSRASLKLIEDKLKEQNSEWRIPTKQDWDELLNAYEVCPFDRTHESTACDLNSNGSTAGRALKSVNYWEPYTVNSADTPTFGENAAGMFIYPLGIMTETNGAFFDTSFGKMAGMWSNSQNEYDETYAKLFTYNLGGVIQYAYGDDTKMSIRLVKDDKKDNFKEIEYIFGLPYKTVRTTGCDEELEYNKIWMASNLRDYYNEFGGVKSEEWSDSVIDYKDIQNVYFINEWDAFNQRWDEKILSDGDSVVIKEYQGKAFREWRVIGEELIDPFDEIVNDFNDKVIQLETGDVQINSKIAQLETKDEQISNSLDEIFNNFSNKIKQIEIDLTALETKLTALEDKSTQLEVRLDTISNNLDKDVKSIVKSYLVGTDREIKFTETENTLTIGFDDDAIFGEI